MGTPHTGAEHLDNFASAAGLMQLSSAAMAADAAEAGMTSGGDNGRNSRESSNQSGTNSSNNTNNNSAVSSPADASLPPGWQRIIHGSGLPCYVHDGLGVVCWTRPYPLDVGGDGALSQPEMQRLVKQHVPPLSIFAPTSDAAARRRNDSFGGLEDVASAGMAPYLSLPAPTAQEPSGAPSKKRKLDAVIKEQKASSKQQSMTLEEFKTLSIGDPRVLQACMELSIKTPAQVLQEYQNRNRGVSINYNTVPLEGDGVKLFKTIVTAGKTVAEGVASTKKIAKQLGAQQLLAMLHERVVRKYYEVAEMYNNSLKGQPIIADTTSSGPATPLRNDARGGGRGNVDPRLQQQRATPNRMRRARRTCPGQDFDAGGGYRDYEMERRENAPPHWSGYNQQPMQHLPPQPGPWTGGGQQQGEVGMDDAGTERVVVYSTTPAAGNAPGAYDGGQYYNTSAAANTWGGYPNANQHMPPQNPPSAYPQQQFNGAYGQSQQPPGSRPYGYGNFQRTNTSTPIERVTANLRNQMNQ